MRIDQSLHGYADGHRLLAASIDLPRQEKYVMLGLSDMSGRSMVSGFEEYLTGYPLTESGFYAFSRTWYAPEMERPGCVWTHTLLMREQDIGAVRDLGTLRRLFTRPRKTGGWEEYRTPLEHLENGHEAHIEPRIEHILDLALWGLYNNDLPFVLPSPDARQFEDMLLALWSQQWPTLRFAFRFCSGSIGVRMSGGSPFDYQVMPPSSIREARREVPASNVVSSQDWTNSPHRPIWLSIASEDLRKGGTPFRSFLREHAGGEFDGRKAFAPLGELFNVREQVLPTTFPGLLQAVGQLYPHVSEAERLKEALAGPGFPLARSLMPGTAEKDVLLALATTTAWSAFDLDELEVGLRALSLGKGDRESAEALIALLIGADLNPIGEEILLFLIQRMSIEDALCYSDAIPGLVAIVVRLNPDYAKSPAVWKGPPAHQHLLFDAVIASGDIPADVQRSIVFAMLQAGSDTAAERAGRKFGAIAVDAVMTWFDESRVPTPWDLREGWRRALASQPSALLDWLASRKEVREASGALIADLSNPHSAEVRERGADLWLRVVANQSDGSPENVRNRLCAFVLALGFEAPEGHSDELVARTFGTVHTALASNRLGEESWGWLEDQLPVLSIWWQWDRCERLRRGLVERFVKYEWPVQSFFRCAANPGALRDLLKTANRADEGDRLLKRIKKAVANEEIELDRESHNVVDWYA
jgi:hypothetical protein